MDDIGMIPGGCVAVLVSDEGLLLLMLNANGKVWVVF